jgi:molybdenum cofactor cytidylyltransferase
MKFGEIETQSAAGAILAHSVKHDSGVFRKGRVLTPADLAVLAQCGLTRVFAAILDTDDVPEDEAAAEVARAVTGDGAVAHAAFTGRANIHAAGAGLALVDADRVRTLNRIHESLTLATLAPFAQVEDGHMLATVKIIPFAVSRAVVAEALAIVGGRPLIGLKLLEARRAGLIITMLLQTKNSLIEKSREAMRVRLEAMGSKLGETEVVDHSVAAVADGARKLVRSGHNPILMFGASAIVDRGDVIPAGLAAAGGMVLHLGMPVDPGNLLMLGRLEGVPVIGVPSCARSPKVNGFDWVLARTLAGVDVSAHDIMDMGAGGLLMEIPSRPAPREGSGAAKAPQIAAIVLAAGLSSRMGSNKLLKEVRGKPMIRKTVEAVLQSRASPVIVVTGHETKRIEEALHGLKVTFIANPDYAKGLSTSLRSGTRQLPASVDGALVVLGDMPLVPPAAMNKLIAAFNPGEGRSICVPVHQSERGNPILWGRQHFGELDGLKGDRGARLLLVVNSDNVTEVSVGSDGVLTDFDTPESLEEIKS